MRLRVLSDLHLEFGPFEPPPCAADVVVLAGDIHTGTQALPWIRQHFPAMPVVLVLGNHEFYGHAAPALVEEFRAAVAGTNVHLLENAAVELAGWRFLGCTLWTDFCLHGAEHQVDAWAQAAALLTDYRRIHHSQEGRLLRSPDTIRWHETSRRWLDEQVRRGNPERTVIVTHHAPSARSLPAHQGKDWLSPAFASNLDEWVASSEVPLWIHGHTHHCVHYRLGSTHVLANQRGYPQEPRADFRPDLVVELG